MLYNFWKYSRCISITLFSLRVLYTIINIFIHKDTLKLKLVSKENVKGLGPIDKIKSAMNYLIFGGDVN